MYHILYDGTIADYRRFVVMGGAKDASMALLEESYSDGMTLREAIQLCCKALLKTNGNKQLTAETLEMALLDKKRTGRQFRRIQGDEIRQLLGDAGSA